MAANQGPFRYMPNGIRVLPNDAGFKYVNVLGGTKVERPVPEHNQHGRTLWTRDVSYCGAVMTWNTGNGHYSLSHFHPGDPTADAEWVSEVTDAIGQLGLGWIMLVGGVGPREADAMRMAERSVREALRSAGHPQGSYELLRHSASDSTSLVLTPEGHYGHGIGLPPQ